MASTHTVSNFFERYQIEIHPLEESLGPTLFGNRSVELPPLPVSKIFEYLSTLDIVSLKQIQKSFKESICSFARRVKIITNDFFDSKIHALILEAFNPALQEAPFLGTYRDRATIPSHEKVPVARGIFVPEKYCTDHGDQCPGEPFISFYVARRGEYSLR